MKNTWFNIAKKPTNAAALVIDIFDPIGFWGVSAQQFVQQLRAAGPVTEIELNVDCPGGDCEEGFTIYDALNASGANITANVIGTAASMASVIICAADKVLIAENGRVMIHRVTAGVDGNADDIAAAAQITKQFEDRIVAIYIEQTGKTEDEIRNLMKSELGTWFFGQEAVDAGFADGLITGQKAAAFKNSWASLFTVLPAALFDTPTPPTPPRPKMKSIIKLAALIGVTGIPDDATEDQIFTAIAAHKPAPQNVVIDFEDAAVKGAFEKAVAAHTKPITDELEKVKAENTRINALIKSGAAGAAGGNTPVTPPQGANTNSKTKTKAEFDAMNPREKSEFSRNGGRISD